jgi:hypothetical protein
MLVVFCVRYFVRIFIRIFTLFAGWLFKIELTNPDELKELMTESEYEKFLKTDAH